jgi:hypothetical protein
MAENQDRKFGFMRLGSAIRVFLIIFGFLAHLESLSPSNYT